MATKLKKMKLTSVDLVRAGANQEADICLYKSAEPQEATESPTEDEKNIFKRFIDWLRQNPQEAENEAPNPIEKGDDSPDFEFIYKSALAESLHSIMQDNTLTEIEKKEMVEESFRQYNEKIQELEDFDEDYNGGDDIDEKLLEEINDFDKSIEKLIEEETIEELPVRKRKRRRTLLWDIDDPENEFDAELDDLGEDNRYEEIEEIEVQKEEETGNPYHAADGKFTSQENAKTTTRPTSRETETAGEGKGVHRRGEGTGIGPVGTGVKPPNKKKRPRKREREISDGGKGVARRGEGTGQGPVGKKADIDEIVHVTKYNHNHGPDGKFSESPGGGSGGSHSSGSSSSGGTSSVKEVPGINHYSGVYDKPYHNQARHLASVVGSRKASGEISAKKVQAAKERGGTVKDFAGKSYMISPQSKGGIAVYIGSKGKNGSFNIERYVDGINVLEDAQMWAVGTILNGD